MKRATELKSKGSGIEVIGEEQFINMIDEELFNLVIQGINWEIEVFNHCEPLINSKGKKIDKSKMAKAVVRLGKILQDKDDIKIAACLDVDFMSFLKSMETAAKEICQK